MQAYSSFRFPVSADKINSMQNVSWYSYFGTCVFLLEYCAVDYDV